MKSSTRMILFIICLAILVFSLNGLFHAIDVVDVDARRNLLSGYAVLSIVFGLVAFMLFTSKERE